jgi:hypothetical protein
VAEWGFVYVVRQKEREGEGGREGEREREGGRKRGYRRNIITQSVLIVGDTPDVYQ